jgi:hypothetical protein
MVKPNGCVLQDASINREQLLLQFRHVVLIMQVAARLGSFQVSNSIVDSSLTSTYIGREQAWILLNY